MSVDSEEDLLGCGNAPFAITFGTGMGLPEDTLDNNDRAAVGITDNPPLPWRMIGFGLSGGFGPLARLGFCCSSTEERALGPLPEDIDTFLGGGSFFRWLAVLPARLMPKPPDARRIAGAIFAGPSVVTSVSVSD